MHPEHLKRVLRHLSMRTAFGGLLLLATTHVAAMDERVPTPSEMRSLPPYCPHTQIISSSYGRKQAPSQYDAQTAPYVDLYGNDFWHLHHYCFGLVQANRAYKAKGASERRGRWTRAIGEIEYVIRSAAPGFVLLPELRTQRANILLKLNRNAEAVLELQKAIDQDPDYARAYAVLADYYRETRNKSLALKTLEDGLTRSPEDRGLLRRYANLGGTKKFVAPPPKEAVVAETPVVEPSPAAAEAAVAPTSNAQAAESSPAKIGNEKNPYCRFCPE